MEVMAGSSSSTPLCRSWTGTSSSQKLSRGCRWRTGGGGGEEGQQQDGEDRKKRKKKLPKSSSYSCFHGLRGGTGDQGILFEYAEHENKEIAGYSGWVDTAPCMKVIGEFIEEKVVRTEEITHKHGQPVKITYGDHLHLYTQSSGSYWLDWMKE